MSSMQESGPGFRTEAGEVRALILDFGEVLTFPQPAAFGMDSARIAGVAEPRFIEAYWAHRREYDLGVYSAHDYWTRVLRMSGAPISGGAADEAVAALIEADVASWTDYREAMWKVALAFRERGGRTAMLSNAVPEILSRIRADRPLDRWFDAVVASCELGVAKPSPGIYEACLELLDVRAEEALFVDDRQDNIEAAAALGLRTVWFCGDAGVESVRRALGT